jgi:hypothetical protein
MTIPTWAGEDGHYNPEGWGATALGHTAGGVPGDADTFEILPVNTLAWDDTMDGDGAPYDKASHTAPLSLWWAIKRGGPRLIVFEVAGTIDYGEQTDIEWNNTDWSEVTIDATTAPGGGIWLKGAGWRLEDLEDFIFRGLRWANTGPDHPKGSTSNCIIFGREGATPAVCRRGMLDHCSFRWATDQVIGVSVEGGSNTVEDITVQWSIVAEGDIDSTHSESSMPPDLKHSMAMLLGGRASGTVNRKFTICNSLLAHCEKRLPRMAGRSCEIEYVNNVHYSYEQALALESTGVHLQPKANIIGSYFKRGPQTGSSSSAPMRTFDDDESGVGPQYYEEDNVGEGKGAHNPANALPILLRSDSTGMDLDAVKETSPIAQVTSTDAPVTIRPAVVAVGEVLAYAGAYTIAAHQNGGGRDADDIRIIGEFKAGTGTIGIKTGRTNTSLDANRSTQDPEFDRTFPDGATIPADPHWLPPWAGNPVELAGTMTAKGVFVAEVLESADWGPWFDLHEVLAPTVEIEDLDVMPGAEYDYRIIAVDNAGNESSASATDSAEVVAFQALLDILRRRRAVGVAIANRRKNA